MGRRKALGILGLNFARLMTRGKDFENSPRYLSFVCLSASFRLLLFVDSDKKRFTVGRLVVISLGACNLVRLGCTH